MIFLTVDLGFLAYWLVTALHVLPTQWLFKDYDNPILDAWNGSFLPLDLLVSATVLWTVSLVRACRDWQRWATQVPL